MIDREKELHIIENTNDYNLLLDKFGEYVKLETDAVDQYEKRIIGEIICATYDRFVELIDIKDVD